MTRNSHTRKLWLLTGEKAGDNAQMLALADALEERGWARYVLNLSFRSLELVTHALMRPTLAGVTADAQAQLRPPWPDLVISAGRRTELVARWIGDQSPTTKIVHLGRPWSAPDCFDLVVTSPQYFVPLRSNVLCNVLPLHGEREVSTAAEDAARQDWDSKLAELVRPWTAVLLGGNSGSFVFTPRLARRWSLEVDHLTKREGTVLLTSSRRTPPGFLDAFIDALRTPNVAYDWHVEQRRSGAVTNPYSLFLALADQFVVSAESVSMTTEALLRSKPTYLLDCSVNAVQQRLRPSYYRWKPLSHRLAMRFAPERFRRDVYGYQQRLVELGYLAWLSSTEPPANISPKQPLRELMQQGLKDTVDRVIALFNR
jgi:mitochondrial fission protein ELM1